MSDDDKTGRPKKDKDPPLEAEEESKKVELSVFRISEIPAEEKKEEKLELDNLSLYEI
jgi:hypothetical protein